MQRTNGLKPDKSSGERTDAALEGPHFHQILSRSRIELELAVEGCSVPARQGGGAVVGA